MRYKVVAFSLIALLSMFTLVTAAWAAEKPLPDQKLASIFPMAEKFVPKNADLTPEKVASIEQEVGTKLRAEDLKSTFYVAVNDKKKPMGLVLFVEVKGPNGVIHGSVGLDMNGQVVKVEVYKHEEFSGIADGKFLKQFIGKGIEDKFKVNEDVEPIAGQQEASQAVALMPKKMLAMSYALFLKRKPATKAEEHTSGTIEPEDLKEVMGLMMEAYNLIRGYSKQEKINKRRCRRQNSLDSMSN